MHRPRYAQAQHNRQRATRTPPGPPPTHLLQVLRQLVRVLLQLRKVPARLLLEKPAGMAGSRRRCGWGDLRNEDAPLPGERCEARGMCCAARSRRHTHTQPAPPFPHVNQT